ncbi:MAG: hypothetical protein H6554_04020 [Chitinophagales bacterium]|nr:hypothetical protein [Chitinophagales bacterium]
MNDPSATVFGLENGNVYEFIWTIMNGDCVDADTVQIEVINPITLTPLVSVCNADDTRTVTVNITGGNGAPYTFTISGTDAAVAEAAIIANGNYGTSSPFMASTSSIMFDIEGRLHLRLMWTMAQLHFVRFL